MTRIPTVLNFQPGTQPKIQPGIQRDEMQDISASPAYFPHISPPSSTNMPRTINQTQQNPFISANKASNLISSHFVPPLIS